MVSVEHRDENLPGFHGVLAANFVSRHRGSAWLGSSLPVRSSSKFDAVFPTNLWALMWVTALARHGAVSFSDVSRAGEMIGNWASCFMGSGRLSWLGILTSERL